MVQVDADRYPRSIFLIIATEFCERFSFCGLRTILSLYLRNVLLFHENKATVIYHVFIMVCYLVPVVGAILADSYLGRFRTILYFSIIYAIGNILMCFAATPPFSVWPVEMTYVGLTLIAWGTGGIKPCVAAFGGDQFHLPHQQKRLQEFFSVFYFTINLGGFTGMILTPILRKAFTCFGDDTCYAVGFGFPAGLMLIALFLFLLGKPLYRLKYPKENIILSFVSCIIYAARRRLSPRISDPKPSHWLDYAQDRFPPKLITDTKTVLAVMFLYIPLPVFWSLFDQQVINPAIVLLLIPLFDKNVYPWLSPSLDSPLRRMLLGGIFAGLAFVTSGLLEFKLEESYPVVPGRNETTLNLVNTLGCDVGILASFDSELSLLAGQKRVFNVSARNSTSYEVYLVSPPRCWDAELVQPTLLARVQAVEYRVDTAIVGFADGALRLFVVEPGAYRKSLSGRPKLRIIFLRSSRDQSNLTVSLESSSGLLQDEYFLSGELISESAYMELEPGSFEYVIRNGSDWMVDRPILVTLEMGAVYLLVLREHGGKIMFHRLFTMVPPNKIHMFWLIPQYLLISIAEVMFAISGLEFSFTQAPNSMKTVTVAAWYASVALGNLIVIVVTQARLFESQAHEFFFFAALILINMLIFALMVARYSFAVLEADSSLIPGSSRVEGDEGDEGAPLLRRAACDCDS